MSTRRSSAAAQKTHDNDSENEDVDMKDRPGSSQSAAEMEDDDGEEGDGSRDLLRMISDVSTYLCELEEDGEELAAGFQRIPNRRSLPDYFEVISVPVAFSTVRQKVLKKQYSAFSEFVRDVAQICHNAQVYNRPSAPIFGAAEKLRQLFKEKLQDMVSKNRIQPSDAILPDLGDLPPVEDSPAPASDAEQDDEEDDDDDEEEEDEEDDDDDDESVDERGRPKKSRGRGQRAAAKRQRDADRDEDEHAKGGRRPPSVLTPMEARISAILKGLRKFKSPRGQLLVGPFEKIPDKALHPDYHATIANPIALDLIKKKTKRKKYQTVDHVMADIERMFENAKHFNEDGSEIHEAAVELQKQARVLAEQEKIKPDDDFRDEEGRLPLPEIEHRGEMWRVGDWVHIRNPNDLNKPIVAQIFRTWQNRDGQRWINACWYYRPEQTVHRFDKHFFDHEVVKTGQYRDHQIEDVLDRCFVMFVTRFNRGRPRGFPRSKEVYVCESRYNEEKARFVKIKTWASCVPDEVRDRDYEMDLFDGPPQRMRKFPSPIKHLLRDDAKESDDLPKPTWGSPNAPPIVGAVHRMPREPHDSPPPAPEPPLATPTVVPVDNTRRPSTQHMPPEAPMRHASTPFNAPGPSPSPSQYQAQMAPPFQPPTPVMGGPPVHHSPMPAQQPPHMGSHSSQTQMRSVHYQQQHHQPMHSNFSQSSMQPMNLQQPHSGFGQPASSTPRTGMATGVGNSQSNMYNPPRPPEVYTVTEAVNEAFANDIRSQFQCDDAGRVLFFTSAPLDRAHGGLSSESAAVTHSAKYLAGREEWLAERARKRKLRDESVFNARNKRSPSHGKDAVTDEMVTAEAQKAMEKWFKGFDEDTARWTETAGLQGWNRSVKS